MQPFERRRFVLPQVAQDPANVEPLLASPLRVIVAAEQQASGEKTHGVSDSLLL
jgi:hypothetical protein